MTKYRSLKTEVDGIVFDSRKEAHYYLIYKSKQEAGEISNLRMQVPYELIPAVYRDVEKQLKTKTKIITKCIQRPVSYVADFVFTDNTGKEHIVDVKGFRTKEYKLKKKMMLAFNGIEIEEV